MAWWRLVMLNVRLDMGKPPERVEFRLEAVNEFVAMRRARERYSPPDWVLYTVALELYPPGSQLELPL